ncbi:MAG: 3-phosphoshikimate 1-carboxyvinyltransferase [Trueperaceae bacterium]|nr:3-phosphoshikimate 1-carboxyvinyltransferase [Trueperaceae bacterium]
MPAYPERTLLVPRGPLDANARVPGSKSITNRALLAAALADGTSTLTGALVAEDADVMIRALGALGADVRPRDDDPTTVDVAGVAGRWPSAGGHLDLALSGTSLRFLTAAVALGHGRFVLDGVARMRERPIGDLVAALRRLGVAASAAGDDRFPPVTVAATGLPGGTTRVAGERSSQFLSGLLLAAPYADGPIEVAVDGTLQSRPFVDLTLHVMRAFGVEVEREGYRRFRVVPAPYRGRAFAVEGDAMAAGYAWGAAALAGGRVRVANVGRDAVQGDKGLLDVLERMGCTVRWSAEASELVAPAGGRLRGGTFDLNDLPDQAQTLAVVALAAGEPVRIVNVGNLRIKETDRLHALAVELRKFGASVDEGVDELTIVPPTAPPPSVEVETYGDHRMAMAFALAGARWPGVRVRGPACVAKTYPAFFDDLAAWGVGVEAA